MGRPPKSSPPDDSRPGVPDTPVCMYVAIITECSTKCQAASGVTAMSHGFVRKRGSSTRSVTRTSAFQLNIEWVHFIWNALVLVTLLVLLPRFRTNPWLIAVTPLAAWHFVEHSVMIATYIQTGISGTPGLLSSGGLLFGGLPIARPDLHFLYNLVETAPLLVAWLVEIRRA